MQSGDESPFPLFGILAEKKKLSYIIEPIIVNRQCDKLMTIRLISIYFLSATEKFK